MLGRRIFHDGMPRLPAVDRAAFDRTATVEAIEPIVLGSRAQGLRFVALDEV
ncbi:hypothetical protein BH20ACT2_BH20ACT2_05920 [soil metagenome]